nr:unnamed protein product [Callosobruchus analis]
MQADGDVSGSRNGAFAARHVKPRYRKQYRDGAGNTNVKNVRDKDGNGQVSTSSRERQQSSSSTSYVNKRNLSNIVCYKCKKNGHYMSKCPSNGKSD